MIEQILSELRERMADSNYWCMIRPKLKKIFTHGSVIIKEIFEIAFVIYGAVILWSKSGDACWDNNQEYMWCMEIFILIGLVKLFIVLVMTSLIVYIKLSRRLNSVKERNALVDILKGISNVKFSALMNESDSDEACSICFVDYTSEDIVSKLDCNSKHIFHQICLE